MYISKKGYRFIQAPEWYSGSTNGNHVAEHIVVMCEKLGLQCIPDGYEVHHIDEDKLNNSIDNLLLMTKSAHIAHHNKNNKYALGCTRTDAQKVNYSNAAKRRWADPVDSEKRRSAMKGKRKKVTCPTCGKEGAGGNMRRYHFDNCKHKQ